MGIKKDDIVNALKVLATMLKHANLSTHDIATMMVTELDGIDFVPKKPLADQLNNAVKFNKSFEALYAISMTMADECIGNKSMKARYAKLEEEFAELMEQLEKPWLKYGSEELRASKTGKHYITGEDEQVIVNVTDIEGELGDVLFVLLHIAHKLKITPFTLLHNASTKMLSRMNDPHYKAKN